MTIQSEGRTLWVRCASDDGSVAQIVGGDDSIDGNVWIGLSRADAGHNFEPEVSITIPMAEAMMIGHWLIAAAKGELPE